jgi:putative transposase
VHKVFGDTGFIQRCTLHKRRNVRDHLPKDQQAWGDRKLAAAFNHDDPAKGERACRDLAAQLAARWPDAAASLREGLEDMFTVRRLGGRRPARREPHEHEAVAPACDAARVA